MRIARFRLHLPEDLWIGEVSRAHPEATFKLLSGIKKGTEAVELGEVTADHPSRIAERIASHGAISDHTLLAVEDRRALAKYRSDDTSFYELINESSVPPEFPLVVQNGKTELKVTGTQEDFRALQDALDRGGLRYEPLSKRRRVDSESLLTTRQREIIEMAYRRGYFGVPRQCTLDEIAEALAVDKSTVSKTLRRAEQRVISEVVLESTDGT